MSVTKPYLYFSPRAATCSRVSMAAMVLPRRQRDFARQQFAQAREQAVQLKQARGRPEAHAQGATRETVRHAHRRQNMAAADLARGAGRARTDADAVEIERHQDRKSTR